MFINEKCKYLCVVEGCKSCSYGCLKNNFNTYKKDCIDCDDFECKYFKKVQE